MSEQSTTDIEQNSSGVARGSAKPQQGEPVPHPGRGGNNVYIDDKPTLSHARGAANQTDISVSDDQPGVARGSGKPQGGRQPHTLAEGGTMFILMTSPQLVILAVAAPLHQQRLNLRVQMILD